MAWFWPNWRIERWCSVSGLEHIQQAREEGKGVLLIGLHFLTLELGARIFGIYNPGIGVYRPHDNKAMDWMQTWGRMRSNKAMLDRKDLKGMIRSLKQGEIIRYAPDHDYGPHASVFVPFLGVNDAATITGTSTLARVRNTVVLPCYNLRLPKGGYQLIIEAPLQKDINAGPSSEIRVNVPDSSQSYVDTLHR